MLYITSPMDQFEVRSLLSLDVPILGNINLYISNIGMYLTIGFLIVLILNILVANNKLVSNYWSISQESIYATIHSIVISQINAFKGPLYFPFVYALFIFVLANNLIGMVQWCQYIGLSRSLCIQNQKTQFSSHTTYQKKLHPYYISGFIDTSTKSQ